MTDDGPDGGGQDSKGGVAPTGLPVEAVMDEVRVGLSEFGAVVLQAEPGAGKTTVVPLRLMDEGWLGDGRIVMLEPRRVAARAAATRMADLMRCPVGQTVGYVTRDERRISRSTRIEVVTDGILTRRIQRDPELTGTNLVIFDEFHERHLQADLGLALVLDARRGLRPDLRVLVMSATVDVVGISRLLDQAPIVTSVGRNYPVSVTWKTRGSQVPLGEDVAATIRTALKTDVGDVLAFLPGVGEIRQTVRALGAIDGVEVLPLHGSLPPREQDRALKSTSHRRVVVATDLAETSVTVEGVGVVVDAGLARRPEYDPASGLTRLQTVRVSRASADQRAGRAGRTRSGVVYRLWSQAEHRSRRAWPEPEITTVDLAGLALELIVWGAPADALSWLTPPDPAALARANQLLVTLGAVVDGRATSSGAAMAALPVHPRLAAMMVQAPEVSRATAALLAALLSERDIFSGWDGGLRATADLGARLAVLQDRGQVSSQVEPRAPIDHDSVANVRRRGAELLRRLDPGGRGSQSSGHLQPGESGVDCGPLVALAYPDRMAQSQGGGRYRLRYGGGAALPDSDPLAGSAWLVAADVDGSSGGIGRGDARIRLAAAIDRRDVVEVGRGDIRTEVRLVWDEQSDDLRAVTETRLDSLIISATQGRASSGPATASALVERAVASGLTELHWTPAARSLQARAMWARRTLGEQWPDVSDDALTATAGLWLAPLLSNARGRADLERVDVASAIGEIVGRRRGELDTLLPARMELASGRTVAVDYSEDRPRIAVKVQDLFGTTRHPSVAGGRVAVTVELLSPAGRPVQVTADLPGFWTGTWKDVRKEMAVRYPKHSWPENPALAAPSRPGPRRPDKRR